MRQRKLFRTAILTDEFRQNPDVDPRTPESVAGFLVQPYGPVLEGDEGQHWEIFESWEQAEDYAQSALQWEWCGDGVTKIKIYPLYAGEGIVIHKQECPAAKPASV
jgi:hypothetical protein